MVSMLTQDQFGRERGKECAQGGKATSLERDKEGQVTQGSRVRGDRWGRRTEKPGFLMPGTQEDQRQLQCVSCALVPSSSSWPAWLLCAVQIWTPFLKGPHSERTFSPGVSRSVPFLPLAPRHTSTRPVSLSIPTLWLEGCRAVGSRLTLRLQAPPPPQPRLAPST